MKMLYWIIDVSTYISNIFPQQVQAFQEPVKAPKAQPMMW